MTKDSDLLQTLGDQELLLQPRGDGAADLRPTYPFFLLKLKRRELTLLSRTCSSPGCALLGNED